jgi:signal transduction histidine kinase
MRRFLELAPYVVPVVTGLLGLLLGPSIRSVARHRRDLGADAAMVDALPEKAKEALREDMGRRAMELIAYSRYPTLTVSDLLTLTAFVASAIYFGWITIDFARTGWALDWQAVVLSWGLLSLFMLTSWATFHARWTDRAAARLRLLQSDVGQQVAEESGRLLRVGHRVSLLGGAGLIGAGVPISLLFAFSAQYDWKPGSSALGYGLSGAAILATGGTLGLASLADRDLGGLLVRMFDHDEIDAYAAAETKRRAKREQRRAAKRDPNRAPTEGDEHEKPEA